MENNKNRKSVKFQGDMLNFCDFIQVFVFTTNHHLNFDTKIKMQSRFLVLGDKKGKLWKKIGTQSIFSRTLSVLLLQTLRLAGKARVLIL